MSVSLPLSENQSGQSVCSPFLPIIIPRPSVQSPFLNPRHPRRCQLPCREIDFADLYDTLHIIIQPLTARQRTHTLYRCASLPSFSPRWLWSTSPLRRRLCAVGILADPNLFRQRWHYPSSPEPMPRKTSPSRFPLPLRPHPRPIPSRPHSTSLYPTRCPTRVFSTSLRSCLPTRSNPASPSPFSS